MRWVILFSLSFLLMCACALPSETRARSSVDHAMTTAAPVRNDGEDCKRCHAAEVDEWRTSMHHASFTSADFQRSYRAEPHEYCVECHAPLRTGVGRRDGGAGIGCAACHSIGEGQGQGQGQEHHHVTTTKSCASCHDFAVPSTRAILQSTEHEHRESAFASTPCEGCHMPLQSRAGSKRRDHRFNVTRNHELLAQAIRVQSARIEGGFVVLSMASAGVGHRFPTGDIFRRLTITLTAFSKDDAVIAGDTFHLSRDWDNHRASLRTGQPETFGGDGDTRLSEVPREFRVACVREPTRVHVTVEYERGASAEGEFFEAFEHFEILDSDVPVNIIAQRSSK